MPSKPQFLVSSGSRFVSGFRGLILAAGLAATVAASSAKPARLSWTDNSDNEAGFKIERSVEGGAFEQIGVVGANVSNYEDTAAVDGIAYRYRVRAFNYIGHSGYTNTEDYFAELPIGVPLLSEVSDFALGANQDSISFSFELTGGAVSQIPPTFLIESSNPELVPVSAVEIIGDGLKRSGTITFPAGASGEAVVTITAIDLGAILVRRSFIVARSGSVSITGQPTDRTVTAAGLTTLAVAASGEGLEYQWFSGESGDRASPIEAGTDRVIAVMAGYETQRYWVEVRSGNEAVHSSAASVQVVPETLLFIGDIWGADGKIAIVQNVPGSLEVFAYVPELGLGFSNPDVALSENGRFAFETEELGWVVGRIEEGIAMGYIVGAKSTFSGAALAADGPRADMAGVYEGAYGSGWISILLAASGDAFVLAENENGVFGAVSATRSSESISLLEDGLSPVSIVWNGLEASLAGEISQGSLSGDFSLKRRQGEGSPSFEGISIRGRCGSGEGALIAGFVIEGRGSKNVLMRGVGPSLTAQGIAEPLADPEMTVYHMGGPNGYEISGRNNDWGASPDRELLEMMTIQAGTFALEPDSLDCAVAETLSGGAYAVLLSGAGSGIALAEIYDIDARSADGATESKLSNFSTRGYLGGGDDSIIAGFVVGGTKPRRFLFRTVGPELSGQGVVNFAANPRISLYGNGSKLASNDDWEEFGGLVQLETARLSALPLESDSTSSAMVIWLDPGTYGVVADSGFSDTGIGLVEVYELK